MLSQQKNSSRRQTLFNRNVGLWHSEYLIWSMLLAGGLAIIFAFKGYGHGEYLPANLATLVGGIVIILVSMDALSRRREKIHPEKVHPEEKDKRLGADQSTSHKQATIRQMGSQSNELALQAVRMVREQGWLRDGSCRSARLSMANLQKANFEYGDLAGADLGAANLEAARLGNVNLQFAKLIAANLGDASLVAASLQFADLQSANLQGARITDADLYGADLTEANLQDATLALSRLHGATFTGATYNHATIWPADFPPPPDAVKVDG
jgi:hypothetical protein